MDEHPPPLRNDKKDADKGKDASPSFHKGNQKSELRKDSLLESDDNDDNDKMIGVIETLAEKHHQTTASSSDLEHSELTAAPQDDNDTTRNRPLPRLLMPATRVVKKPPSLTNLHPGAYLVDGFPAPVNHRTSFVEYDVLPPPSSSMNHTPLEVPDSTAGAVTDDEGDRPSLPKTISATLIARISRRQAVILSLVVVVGAIAIAVGVGVGVGGKGKTSTPPSSSMCDFAGQGQPNIFLQCQCFATVHTISPPLSQSYQSLLTSLVPQVIPDFQDSVNSCSAANQALLWLANDTLTTTTTIVSGLNSSRLTNRLLLALLYTTWGGTGWKQSEGWLSSSDECNWYGVACQSQHVVTQLSLDHNNLTSIIPTELFELTGLESLLLADNALIGTFPSAVSRLTKLKYLNISQNSIISAFPFSMLPLDLVGIDVSANFFVSVTIPPTIGQLTNLEILLASLDSVISTIPTEIGLATQLAILDLSSNVLVGQVPTEFGNLSNLAVLLLHDNELTGTIPSELGLIPTLEILDMSNNIFRGSIPSGLFHRPLKILNLDNNDLSGALPLHIGNASQLECLDVTRNRLQTSSPASLCQQVATLKRAAVDCSGLVNFANNSNSSCPCCNCHSACARLQKEVVIYLPFFNTSEYFDFEGNRKPLLV